jgi:hypothetical protein
MGESQLEIESRSPAAEFDRMASRHPDFAWEPADHAPDTDDADSLADPWSPATRIPEPENLPPEGYWAALEKAEDESSLQQNVGFGAQCPPGEDELDIPDLPAEKIEDDVAELFDSPVFERPVDLLDEEGGLTGEASVADDGDFEFDDFDPRARQAPWLIDLDDEPILLRAREKAEEIAAFVDARTKREDERVVSFLMELFKHLSHANTFRAIRQAAAEGLNSEQLFAMVELRRIWTVRPEWWVGRYNRFREIAPLPNGPSALSWRAALRVCCARSEYPPDEMIPEEWLYDWQRLVPGDPGFLSFPAYINVCIDSSEADFLSRALAQHARDDGAHPADALWWHRELGPEHEEALRSCRTLFCPDNKSRWQTLPVPKLKKGGTQTARTGTLKGPVSVPGSLFAPHLNLLPPPQHAKRVTSAGQSAVAEICERPRDAAEASAEEPSELQI